MPPQRAPAASGGASRGGGIGGGGIGKGGIDDPTLAMIEAGYDATRREDGTPQFFDAGFTLAHVGVIFRAVARNALDSARYL